MSTEMPFDEIKADKTARQDLDKTLQNIKALPPSRERALGITKLQEAIMWLGMDLKRLGNPDPYQRKLQSGESGGGSYG